MTEEPNPQHAPLGEPFPQPGRRYHFLRDSPEDATIKTIAIQYAAVALGSRLTTADEIYITPQEVQLAKAVGVMADIDEHGGISIKFYRGMGS